MLVLSFLASASVWTLHNLSLKYSVIISVPVQAECDALDGYASRASENETVQAKCRATGFDILRDRFYGKDSPCRVRFSADHLHPRESGVFYMTAKDLGLYAHDIFGESASIEYFLSDSSFFRFQRREYKKVPVVLDASINLAPQYVMPSEVALSPDSVLVYAEPQLLERIASVSTRKVVLQALDEVYSASVRLKVPPSTRLSVPQVLFTVPVVRQVERRFRLVPRWVNAPAGLPAPEEVSLVANCVFPVAENAQDEVEIEADYALAKDSPSHGIPLRLKSRPSWLLSYRIEPEILFLPE